MGLPDDYGSARQAFTITSYLERMSMAHTIIPTPSDFRRPSQGNWAIVLAGGEGDRLRPRIEGWLGYHCPKQYCTFVGTRSMLQHTLDRAKQLVSADRIITVMGKNHSRFLNTPGHQDIPGRVIEQPSNKSTGPGIFLPATYIMAADPSATVLIFPSDHFIFPESLFLVHVARASRLAQYLDDRIILLACRPDQPEVDYGWIEPSPAKQAWDRNSQQTASNILSFQEKPSPQDAEIFLGLGYLANTMIMAVKIKTLWALGHRFFPQMMRKFEVLLHVLQKIHRGSMDKKHEQTTLFNIYQELQSANFSKGLLQCAAEDAAVLLMDDIAWSDWGRSDRIVETLNRMGRPQHFSRNLQPGLEKVR